jgi:WD40 repeat protein
MTGPRSIVLGRQKPPEVAVAFSPDGHLLSTSAEGVLRRWPVSYADGEDVREYRPGGNSIGLPFELDREGRSAVLTASVPAPAKVLVVPLDGSEPARYELKDKVIGNQARVDPSGRLVALSAGSNAVPKLNGVRIIDLVTRAERRLDDPTGGAGGCGNMPGMAVPVWLRDGRLITDGYAGLRVWDLASGRNELLRPCRPATDAALSLLLTPDSRSVLRLDVALGTSVVSSLSVFDLASRVTREIASHGNVLMSFALDASGRILVTGDRKGVIRVGPLTGEAPHLLYGHTGAVTGVAISRDGRWIASGGDDGTIRRWPMPDLSKPPLHTLPHDALVAALRALTNLRAGRDPGSDTGWKIEVGPFPGWAKVPTWNP